MPCLVDSARRSLVLVGLPTAIAMLSIASSACSSSEGGAGGAPAGVTCSSSIRATDAASAQSALASAASGSCVLLAAGSYIGPFTVKAGVSLATEAGARATISGGVADAPAITVEDGASLASVDVANPGGVGIAVRSSRATLRDVTVTGAPKAAIAVRCPTACSGGTVELVDVSLSKSALGLWVSGAHVAMKGGASREHVSTGLTGAMGVVAVDGATLELDGVTVEKNQGAGVLVDGTLTKATIKNSTVSENKERGVWLQKVTGTLDNPAVRIEGSTMTKNGVIGMGGVEARGIIIVGGTVAFTQAAPIATDISGSEMVGDGIGLFGGTTDFKADGTTIADNARAAGLVDGSIAGIIIVGGSNKISAGPSGLKLVVQGDTGADLQVDAAARSTSARLGVSAPKLVLPNVL